MASETEKGAPDRAVVVKTSLQGKSDQPVEAAAYIFDRKGDLRASTPPLKEVGRSCPSRRRS